MRASTSPAIDVPAGLVACLVVCIAFLPFTTLEIDPYHDGVMLKPAMDVLSGQTLFRDSLMLYGALTTWLQAAAMALLGPTLRALRLSTVCAYGLAAGALVMCWRLVLPRPLAIGALVLWVLFAPVSFALHPWPSVYALCFQSMALLALMRAVSSSGGPSWALASGVLAGLTLLSRQLPTGVFTCAGVLAALVAVGLLFPAYRRRAIGGFIGAAAGMAVVVATFLVHLVSQGSLDAWWQQTIVWAWQWSPGLSGVGMEALRCLDLWLPYGSVFGAVTILALLLVRIGRPLTAALAIGLAAVWVLFAVWFGYVESFGQGVMPIALVLALGATLCIALRNRRAPREETVLALVALIVALGSWTQAYPLGDPGHLFWGISLSYGFSVFAAWQLGGRRTALVAAVLILLWSPYAVGKALQWQKRLTTPRVTLTDPPLLAGMRERPHRAVHWTRLANAMREYSRTRPRWAMLLEGDNMVAAALAPDLSNSGPYFAHFRGAGTRRRIEQLVPYDGAQRARFILRERPLIFSEQPPGELVRQAMELVGYEPLLKLPQAVLLAPREPAAGDRPAADAQDGVRPDDLGVRGDEEVLDQTSRTKGGFMGATATALIGFAGWFALLSIALGVYRGRLVLAGRKAANAFATDGRDLDALGQRLTRARDNCFESLPMFVAVALGASLAGRLDVTDPLAMWVLFARIAQSVTHIVSTSVPAVILRANLFFVQVLIYVWWAIRLLA